MLNPKQLANLADASLAAVATEHQYKLPAELTIAQWALETGWGVEMPGGSFNPFGIKALPGQDFVEAETTEYINNVPQRVMQKFAKYPSLTDAFNAHAELLTTGRLYAPFFVQFLADGNLFALIDGIALHYSTSPSYAQQLKNILAMTAVNREIADARNAPPAGSGDGTQAV